MNQTNTETEVLIAGAGPTGLVLALWLTAQGVRVRIVDKTPAPGTTSRAIVVHARTLELYQQLGFGDTVAGSGHKLAALNMWVDGKRRAHIPFGLFGGALTPYPFVLIYPQDLQEKFLVDRLREWGVEVERQTEILDFKQNEHGITARLGLPDGAIEKCSAAYLAGCDGAASTVRNQLGADFEGGTYEQLFYVADISAGAGFPGGDVHVSFEGSEFALILPYGEPGSLRCVGTVRADRVDDIDALAFEDVYQNALQAVDIEAKTVNWFSTYHVHHRVTDHFRHGRVLLLGDAAHIHSPAGGQGMNTGIGDAINLAWKLAAVLKGRAGDRLIDSYEAERLPFARKLVKTTDRAFSGATSQSNIAGFVRTHVAPVVARTLFRLKPARMTMFGVLSQLGISYPDSPLSVGRAGKVKGGDRLPYVQFGDDDNFASLSTTRWQAHVYGEATTALGQWCAKNNVPLHEYPWQKKFGKAGLAHDAVYLLRPDSYVGLANGDGDYRAVEAYFAEQGLRPGGPNI